MLSLEDPDAKVRLLPESSYVNLVGSSGSTDVTFVETLYSTGRTSLILTGVPTENPCGCSAVTVTVFSPEFLY